MLAFAVPPARPLAAAETGPEPLALSLREIVERALAASDAVAAHQSLLSAARYGAREVRSDVRTPRMNFDLATGVVGDARGDVQSSPDDQDDLDDFGPFYKLNLALVQPIHTFGKGSAAIDTAERAADLAASRLRTVRERTMLETVEAAWTLDAAERALGVATEIRERYEELLEEVDLELEDPASDLDRTHLLEARTYRHEVESGYQTALDTRNLARGALCRLIGEAEDCGLAFESPPLPRLALDEAGLSRLIDGAASSHPEVRELAAQLETLEARLRLAENERNPTAFFAGGVRYAYAPDREDQDNPFAYDNFNYFDVGGFLGMEWTFDPRGDALAIHRREAERDAAYFGLRAKRLQVELEVRKAFLQVESAARLRQAAESSLDAARDWVRVASDHWDLGLGEPDRLLRAYRSYFERESALLATEADFHSSLAGLAMASVGMDTYLRWTDVGDVVVP